jgi:hypothetical protein
VMMNWLEYVDVNLCPNGGWVRLFRKASVIAA